MPSIIPKAALFLNSIAHSRLPTTSTLLEFSPPAQMANLELVCQRIQRFRTLSHYTRRKPSLCNAVPSGARFLLFVPILTSRKERYHPRQYDKRNQQYNRWPNCPCQKCISRSVKKVPGVPPSCEMVRHVSFSSTQR